MRGTGRRPRNARRPAAAVAAALLALAVAGGCTAERDPDDAAAGPGHTDEVLDAADLHYVPARLSSLVAGTGVQLEVEPVGPGYRLTATRDGQTSVVEVAPTATDEVRQSEVGGPARRAAYELDEAADRITWSDALATVTITAPGAAAQELTSLADAVLLVDTPTYEALLADPAHRFGDGEAVQARLALASRTLELELTGSLADQGLVVSFEGLGPSVGTDAELLATQSAGEGASQLLAWQEDGRNRAVLLVPDGFERLTSTQRDLRWWQAEDARLGRVVLLDGPGDRALRITVEVAGRPDDEVRIDPMDGY